MPTERIRVLLTGLPTLLNAILMNAMQQDNDIELQSADAADTLAASIARCRPDVLIAPHCEPALLFDAPRLQVYLLSGDARTSRHLALRPFTNDLGELSVESLLSAIKQRRAEG